MRMASFNPCELKLTASGSLRGALHGLVITYKRYTNGINRI